MGQTETQPQASGNSVIVSGTSLKKRYGSGDAAVDALRGVDVSFKAGSLTAIMGPSGSGKSTLMHILAGLDTPTSGKVEIDGTRIDELSDQELTALRRDQLGFIFQSYNLLPVLTAEENIVLPLAIAGKKIDQQWLSEVLDAFGLTERRKHRPSEMSGGQQQRVAVARALINRPAVIFADEPTGNLDSKTSQEVQELLRNTVDNYGRTIVMVTHDPVAAAIADRVLFLADGCIVRERERINSEEILDELKAL